ncbi:O-antigen ligase family protein [Vibrio sp. JC009]|uniref:O-antigen ligase family protein n=1 Tax=Vibrio sp. JC009 TaxID=2912314 RepID=UPI0023B06855|nr:O-antigen ligase family protein [Vibrio sp. JC009]WED21984.1 O-antigen ligase family protein [Vibrio sp. JC009]
MKSSNTFLKEQPIQMTFLCLLGISFFVYKGGLYLFPVLTLLGYFYFRSFHYINYNTELSLFVKTLLGLLVVGTITSLFSLEGYTSTIDFTRKAIPLLAVPVSFYYFKIKEIRRAFSYSLAIGLVIACGQSALYILKADLAHFSFDITRFSSFWDLGRWGEILSYVFALLIPIAFKTRNLKVAYAIRLLLLIVLAFIVMSGSRAAILVLGIITAAYFLLYNRKYLLPFILVGVGLATIFHIATPNIAEAYKNRVASIIETDGHKSNLARLRIWEEASLYAAKNFKEDQQAFLFGTGVNKIWSEFEQHLQSENKLEKLVKETDNQFSTRDHHNAFLNMLNRMGAIYTFIFCFMMLHSLLISLKKSFRTEELLHQSAFLILLSYCIFGIFYSNELSYQTYIMFFLWSFAFTYAPSTHLIKGK